MCTVCGSPPCPDLNLIHYKKQPALFCLPICRSIPTVGRRLPNRQGSRHVSRLLTDVYRKRRQCANRRKTAVWRCRLPIRQGRCLVLVYAQSAGQNSYIGRLQLVYWYGRFGRGVYRYGQTGGRMRSNRARKWRLVRLSGFGRNRCCCPAKTGRTVMQRCDVP